MRSTRVARDASPERICATLEDARVIGAAREVAILTRLLARSRRLLGDLDAATRAAVEAKALARAVGDRYEWCLATLEEARVERARTAQVTARSGLPEAVVLDLRQASMFLLAQHWTRALDDLTFEFVDHLGDEVIPEIARRVDAMRPHRPDLAALNRRRANDLATHWSEIVARGDKALSPSTLGLGLRRGDPAAPRRGPV